ncbi:MAG: prephenate dehydrogenase [Bryobacteraceae bacterium]
METVAIVGVGLIGGSFALALRAAGFSGRILGVSSEATLRKALERGVIEEAATLAEAAGRADLLYLAQPIARILDTLRRLEPLVRPGALVTDAGSTKRAIAAAGALLARAQFLGGHPMAGKEKRGVEEAEAGLFAGRPYVLTPPSPEALRTDAALEFRLWLERIGARVLTLAPEEHDRVVALTSHLAQLASTALATTVAEAVPDRVDVAGPGLVDSTRLALSPYELWRDILATNSAEIDRALAAYIARLEHLRANLRTREMQREFETAAALAARLRRA